MKCPVCGQRDNTVLVCRKCWFLVPAKERFTFWAQYRQNPKNPKAYASKADSIIRKLKAIASTKPAPCDHDWVVSDDSFDHEFGTERLVSWQCEKCGASTNKNPRPDGPDDDRID